MADFSIGKIMNTFFVSANTPAAMELCTKIVTPETKVHVGDDGALIFPPSHDEILCKLGRAIVGAGLSMEDKV